jgi:type II secretory pathway component HofQ
MRRKSLLFFVLALSWQSLTLHAEEMTLEIIPLQHRLVDDVVTVLRPLVTPGGTVTGMNNQLIIKTTPANLADLKKVLETLDRSPRQLLITVKQGTSDRVYQQDESLSGRFSAGDISVAGADPGHREGGLVISAGDEKGNIVRYRSRSSDSSLDDRNTFRVQATEGYPAYIHAGQSIPVPARTEYVTPGGVIVSDSIEYHDATSGFYVLPRLNGDQVTLLVAPRLARFSSGHGPAFDVQDIETTATGRLGEWIELGGINQDFSDRNRQNLNSLHIQGLVSRTVLIKVDEIK